MPWIPLLHLANLADLPQINGPPTQLSIDALNMPWIMVHQTWQIYPQSIKCRCLEYHYTKLGRSTGRSTPNQLSIDALNTLADLHQSSIDALALQIYPQSIEHRCLEYCYTPNLANLLADLPDLPPNPINLAEMPWILQHQTWQIYPQSIKHRCFEYHYTKLGRSTPISGPYMPWILLYQTWHIYWQIYPHQWSIDALNTATPNLADLPPSIEHSYLEYCYTKLGRSIPSQLSIDALNTTTPNLADLTPSMYLRCLNNAIPNLADLLADLPYINWA